MDVPYFTITYFSIWKIIIIWSTMSNLELRWNWWQQNVIYIFKSHLFFYFKKVLTFENVAIIAKFSLKTDATVKFLVATTHLQHSPKRQDVRLAQSQLLLAEIHRMSSKKIPVIITGDLNCMPFSAPFDLFVQGKLDYAKLTQHSLTVNYFNDIVHGNKLLPVSLGISDDCKHVNSRNNDTKVSKKFNFCWVLGSLHVKFETIEWIMSNDIYLLLSGSLITFMNTFFFRIFWKKEMVLKM